jgi:hypothetical protein
MIDLQQDVLNEFTEKAGLSRVHSWDGVWKTGIRIVGARDLGLARVAVCEVCGETSERNSNARTCTKRECRRTVARRAEAAYRARQRSKPARLTTSSATAPGST